VAEFFNPDVCNAVAHCLFCEWRKMVTNKNFPLTPEQCKVAGSESGKNSIYSGKMFLKKKLYRVL
jgi:hypothetical protein